MSVVVVTGGSRGIGSSVALDCARRGMGVILTYNKSPDSADAVVKSIGESGGKAIALPLDVTVCASFPAFASAVQDELSSAWGLSILHGLVNNAGYGLFNPIATVSEAEFDGLMNVHLKGPFFITQALLPLMARGSSIVNVTSATTRVATIGVAPYASMKGGLEVLTRYMAKEFGERGIRANAVSPGAVRTELGGGLTPEFEALLSSQTALGRIGEPADVARTVSFLLSTESEWVNAQSIEVAGGYFV